VKRHPHGTRRQILGINICRKDRLQMDLMQIHIVVVDSGITGVVALGYSLLLVLHL
jgi:hypothetical protein